MVALPASLSAQSFPLHCLLSRAALPQEFSKVDVGHRHVPVSASHSTSGLSFPHHFSIFVASSLNLWGWWHEWSGCYLLRPSSWGQEWLLPPPLSSWRLRPYRMSCHLHTLTLHELITAINFWYSSFKHMSPNHKLHIYKWLRIIHISLTANKIFLEFFTTD